jgi:hypothetical protein
MLLLDTFLLLSGFPVKTFWDSSWIFKIKNHARNDMDRAGFRIIVRVMVYSCEIS